MTDTIEKPISLQITGTYNFGGGITYHTEYQILVKLTEQQTWTIYRRYSHFEKLHKHILTKFPEPDLKARGIVFPEKIFIGSYFSTQKSVITQRRSDLQLYLDTLFHNEHEDLLMDETMAEFLDYSNKGISGLQRQFSSKGNDSQQVLKESFCKVEIIRQYLPGYRAYHVVVLTKDGNLYILQSMYDTADKALMHWLLTAVGVKVIPKSRNNTLVITSTAHSHKLVLQLPTSIEAAFWIRSLSDFSTSTHFTAALLLDPPLADAGTDQSGGGGIAKRDALFDSKVMNTATTSTVNKRSSAPPTFNTAGSASAAGGKKASQRIPHQIQAKEEVKQIYAKGTGTTEDELSSAFGI